MSRSTYSHIIQSRLRGDPLFLDGLQDVTDIRVRRIVELGEPVGDDPFGVGHENDRMRDARMKGRFIVQNIECFDNFGIGIGLKRESDLAPLGEMGKRADIVSADHGYVVAEVGEIFLTVAPDDRLGFTVGSPIERSGEQQDQSGPADE